jgi:CHAT domain-containing protein
VQQVVLGLQFGNVLRSLGEWDQSNASLTQALGLAQDLHNPELSSQIWISLGHTARAQNQVEQAFDYYRKALDVAPTDLAQFQARVSELDLAIVQGEAFATQMPRVTALLQQYKRLTLSRSSLYSQIHFATLMQRSLTTDHPFTNTATILELLRHTANQAQQLGDNLSLAYSLGYQGQIYEQTGQWTLAEALTEQALTIAQSILSAEVNYPLLWQLGRILNQQGQTQAAIVAYRNAIETLKGIRTEIASSSQDLQFSFRDSVEPIYREFVKLLLAEEQPNSQHLIETRDLIEGLQLEELNDYFQDACTPTKAIVADQIDPKAAVIYSIVLDDRLAVIVSLNQGKKLLYHTQFISSASLEQSINQLRRRFSPLRSNQVQTLAQFKQFYDWLVAPFESELQQAKIETLVFVSDAALRQLPVSALYTGDRYLIEDYNIAISPGLKIMDPQSNPQEDIRLLAGGLSQINTLFANQFVPLPYVENELNAITTIVPKHQEYLNQALTESELSNGLNQTQANVVHLATHGEFGQRAEDTFLLTWDSKLNIDEFSRILKAHSTHQHPIQLLVLSACKTAEGNDRSVLGIAGMAIRANARSVIAGLWPVNDQATATFMTDFYQALSQPDTTKSQAFRQAQLSLLRSSEFQAPYYWAPFVLVGNWL